MKKETKPNKKRRGRRGGGGGGGGGGGKMSGTSRIQKALGAVKDQTTISIAKVSKSSSIQTELEITIVKATRHDSRPAEERHIREILNLTRYSRQSVTLCVSTITRRLSKTQNWVVALKALVLIHRLLIEGDQSYEEEVFFATKRGTRLLNMSEFRDRTGLWDFSAFVRTFSRYLDERLEYKMQGRRDGRGRKVVVVVKGNVEEESANEPAVTPAGGTPVREMSTAKVLSRFQHLMIMMERFLACRPTGAAKDNSIVAVALYPMVKESHQIYYDQTEIMALLVDRFMELEVPFCVKVRDLFTSLSKQLDDLNSFYNWCKNVGIGRTNDYPVVEKITQKRLDLMDEFIRERSLLARKKTLKSVEVVVVEEETTADDVQEKESDEIKALPPPEKVVDSETGEREENAIVPVMEKEAEKEVDLLNLYDDDDTVTEEQHGDRLALALFDGTFNNPTTTTSASATARWETFTEEHGDWELALVQSATNLQNQKPSLGGGFDTLILDGMYQQSQFVPTPVVGSASSVALPSSAQPMQMWALPAPPGRPANPDPFAASTMVAPPSYVQMADMEKKQRYLVEEQVMWQQYAIDGMQGSTGLAKVQASSNGGYQSTGYQQQQRLY